jgi:hypothetical protein
VSEEVSQAVMAENQETRVATLDASIALLAILAMLSLFFTGSIPREQPGASVQEEATAQG